MLPGDVASFVERRRICDHLRGEEPYSRERAADLSQGTEKYCRGTDRELAALRVKYRNDSSAAKILENFETNIEARK
jgi:hypothetical protein